MQAGVVNGIKYPPMMPNFECSELTRRNFIQQQKLAICQALPAVIIYIFICLQETGELLDTKAGRLEGAEEQAAVGDADKQAFLKTPAVPVELTLDEVMDLLSSWSRHKGLYGRNGIVPYVDVTSATGNCSAFTFIVRWTPATLVPCLCCQTAPPAACSLRLTLIESTADVVQDLRICWAAISCWKGRRCWCFWRPGASTAPSW